MRSDLCILVLLKPHTDARRSSKIPGQSVHAYNKRMFEPTSRTSRRMSQPTQTPKKAPTFFFGRGRGWRDMAGLWRANEQSFATRSQAFLM